MRNLRLALTRREYACLKFRINAQGNEKLILCHLSICNSLKAFQDLLIIINIRTANIRLFHSSQPLKSFDFLSEFASECQQHLIYWLVVHTSDWTAHEFTSCSINFSVAASTVGLETKVFTFHWKSEAKLTSCGSWIRLKELHCLNRNFHRLRNWKEEKLWWV